jgi:muramidase (phage lysozyme)
MFEETGIGIKNPLWFVGVVENRNDPRKEGRVQVRAFGVHGTNKQVTTERLPWAICIAGNYDPNYPIPPLNSWVFGFFLDGRDAQQPMILGLIPTQMTGLIDPEANGWGVIPTQNVDLDSQGSRATDYGQPQNSRKARGEEIQNTGVLLQEVNRIEADFSSAVEGLSVQEPPPAYNTQYPYNRVIETAAGHSIELDDSPGGKRITIFHNTGSFIEIDNGGVMNVKATGDLFLSSMKNIIIVAEGRQMIKVKGDAVFSVDGSMIHEVSGDMQQIVRGNYQLSVGGQLNLNASEEIQARAAKVRIEANVEGINLKSGKKINIQAGEAINIKSAMGILQEAVGDFNIKGDNFYTQSEGAIHFKAGDSIFQEAAADINIKGDNLFIQGTGDTNIKSAQIFLDSAGNMNIRGAYTKIGNGQVSINGTSVAIDEFVFLANGQAVTAPGGTAATVAEEALPAEPAEGAELPEPAAKSTGNGGTGSFTGGTYRNPSASGGGGYISADDLIAGATVDSGPGSSTGSANEALSSSYTQGALTPLLDLLGRAEGAGYDTIVGFVRKEDYPAKPITLLTVDELLAWQDSIDAKYNSEASGRYQVMEDTLRGLKSQGVVSGSDLFGPATQDKIAVALLKIRGLNRFLNGIITSEQFGDNLSYEWASLPVMTGPRAGQGRYSGQGGKIRIQEVLDVLKKVKDYNVSSTAGPTTGIQ